MKEILWTFSIYLEAVAIVPQLFLLQKTEVTDVMTWHYVFCMGLYRACYIVNWVNNVPPLPVLPSVTRDIVIRPCPPHPSLPSCLYAASFLFC